MCVTFFWGGGSGGRATGEGEEYSLALNLSRPFFWGKKRAPSPKSTVHRVELGDLLAELVRVLVALVLERQDDVAVGAVPRYAATALGAVLLSEVAMRHELVVKVDVVASGRRVAVLEDLKTKSLA